MSLFPKKVECYFNRKWSALGKHLVSFKPAGVDWPPAPVHPSLSERLRESEFESEKTTRGRKTECVEMKSLSFCLGSVGSPHPAVTCCHLRPSVNVTSLYAGALIAAENEATRRSQLITLRSGTRDGAAQWAGGGTDPPVNSVAAGSRPGVSCGVPQVGCGSGGTDEREAQ